MSPSKWRGSLHHVNAPGWQVRQKERARLASSALPPGGKAKQHKPAASGSAQVCQCLPTLSRQVSQSCRCACVAEVCVWW
jgi:hypothetical protein